MVDQSSTKIISNLKSFAGIAALAVILIGVLVLDGWIFNILILTMIFPNLPQMVPNTAFSFILLGISLWLIRSDYQKQKTALKLTAKILSFIVILVGGLTLAEYLFDWNLGIDELFSQDFLGSIRDLKPLRMAPHTAFNFFILGLSILIINIRFHASYRIAQYLALIGLLVSLLAFVGYVYNFSYFIGTMAIHTSFSFFILSLGILASRPDKGVMATVTSDSAGGVMIRRLSFPVIIIPILTGLIILIGQRANYYGALFSLSLFTITLIAVFILFLLTNSESLNRIDIERKKAKSLSDTLNDINSIINSTLNIDKIIQRVLADGSNAINSENAAVFLREGEDWIPKYHYKLPMEMVEKKYGEEELPIAVFDIKNKKPIVIDDTLKEDGIIRRFEQQYNVRSFLSVPLMSKERVNGFLFFGNVTADAKFEDYQIDFVTKLAVSVTLAIENARAYKIERNISNTLQDALLTMPSRIKGLKFSYDYHSASVVAKVGGDFYDIYELENDKVSILIGDVSGSGLKASALTADVKNTLRAYSFEMDSPSAIVEKTNVLIDKITDSSTFVTLFFGILDLKSSKLKYCNAGHTPIILKKGASSTKYLLTGDMPIGLFADVNYSEKEETITKDDILFLYTDGVIEARRGKEFFGEERLTDFVNKINTPDTKKILQLVLDEILRFTENKLSDDVAMFVVSTND